MSSLDGAGGCVNRIPQHDSCYIESATPAEQSSWKLDETNGSCLLQMQLSYWISNALPAADDNNKRSLAWWNRRRRQHDENTHWRCSMSSLLSYNDTTACFTTVRPISDFVANHPMAEMYWGRAQREESRSWTHEHKLAVDDCRSLRLKSCLRLSPHRTSTPLSFVLSKHKRSTSSVESKTCSIPITTACLMSGLPASGTHRRKQRGGSEGGWKTLQARHWKAWRAQNQSRGGRPQDISVPGSAESWGFHFQLLRGMKNSGLQKNDPTAAESYSIQIFFFITVQ